MSDAYKPALPLRCKPETYTESGQAIGWLIIDDSNFVLGNVWTKNIADLIVNSVNRAADLQKQADDTREINLAIVRRLDEVIDENFRLKAENNALKNRYITATIGDADDGK